MAQVASACGARVGARISSASGSSRFAASQRSTACQWSVSYRSQSSSDEAITETTGRPDVSKTVDGALEGRPRLVAGPRSRPAAGAAASTARRRRRGRRAGPPARAPRPCPRGCRRRSSRRGRARRRRPPARASPRRRRRARTSAASASPAASARSTATAWKSGEISTPRTLHPNVSRRGRAPARRGPDAMSRTRDSGPRPSRSPRRTSFSARGRVLQLVERLGDDEVAGDHGRII